jgi:hypothetical protein
MATRTVTIIECDLCGRETDDLKSLGVIKIKRPQARKEQEHEVCRDCIERLMTQIASTEVLENGINLALQIVTSPSLPYQEKPVRIQEHDESFQTAAERRQQFSRAEIDDDEAFVAQKMREREEHQRSQSAQSMGDEPVADPDKRPGPRLKTVARNDCSHPNKSKPWSNDDGKTMYRTCRSCKANIRMMNAKQRAAYGAARTGGHDLAVGSNANIKGKED